MRHLRDRNLDPEACVAQGGHCFARHSTSSSGAEENRWGQRVAKIVQTCRHCPAYRIGFEPPPHWVEWGEVQVPGAAKERGT